VSVTGGTAPYTYAWSNGGSTTNILSNLPIGNYTITVTDNNGCFYVYTWLMFKCALPISRA
ncbi:MAG: hypothetical protein ACPGLV_16390, partial [Bacteroidia bacterium]